METHQKRHDFPQTHQPLTIALLHSATEEDLSPLRFKAAAAVIAAHKRWQPRTCSLPMFELS